MSTHYLIDLHTNPVANSEINDVRFSAAGSSVLGGNFIIRVSDGVSLGTVPPTDLTDLLTKKYQGLMAFHPGYTRITFDDLLDATNVDLVNSALIVSSDRVGCSIVGLPGGIFQSLPVALTGPAPVQAVIAFETFDVTDDYPMLDRTSRTYSETDPGAVGTCDVSFNGGITFLTGATDGGLINIPIPDQGTSFVFRFNAGSVFPARVFLGSWAVLY